MLNCYKNVFIMLDIPKCPAELYDHCEYLLEYIATSFPTRRGAGV